MSWTIRLLTNTPADYTRFSELIKEFRDTTFTYEQFCTQLAYMSTHSQIWVMDMSGELVGTATLLYERKFIFNICTLAHIEDVCIKTTHRRQGLGKILIETLIEEATAANCYKITLDCMPPNVDFYKACSFELRGHQMTKLLKAV